MMNFPPTAEEVKQYAEEEFMKLWKDAKPALRYMMYTIFVQGIMAGINPLYEKLQEDESKKAQEAP